MKQSTAKKFPELETSPAATGNDPSAWRDFVFWERAARDSIDVKRQYIDAAGGCWHAGALLSQIIYYELSPHDADFFVVDETGVRWIARERDRWWSACRLSPDQYDRALKKLQERELVVVEVRRLRGAPVKHVRLDRAGFLRRIGELEAATGRCSEQPGYVFLYRATSGALKIGACRDLERAAAGLRRIIPGAVIAAARSLRPRATRTRLARAHAEAEISDGWFDLAEAEVLALTNELCDDDGAEQFLDAPQIEIEAEPVLEVNEIPIFPDGDGTTSPNSQKCENAGFALVRSGRSRESANSILLTREYEEASDATSSTPPARAAPSGAVGNRMDCDGDGRAENCSDENFSGDARQKLLHDELQRSPLLAPNEATRRLAANEPLPVADFALAAPLLHQKGHSTFGERHRPRPVKRLLTTRDRRERARQQKSSYPLIVQALHTVTNRYPPKTLWEQLDEMLPQPDVGLLMKCATEFVRRRPRAFLGDYTVWLYDWYFNGIPAEEERGTNNGNGKEQEQSRRDPRAGDAAGSYTASGQRDYWAIYDRITTRGGAPGNYPDGVS